MSQRKHDKNWRALVLEFLKSRPSDFPSYKRFYIGNRKNNTFQSLLKSEHKSTKRILKLLKRHERLIQKIKAIEDAVDTGCCDVYGYWIEIRNILGRKN